MKCPYCGTEMMEGISFCTNCGKMLKDAAKIEPVIPDMPVMESVTEPKANAPIEASMNESKAEPVNKPVAKTPYEEPVSAPKVEYTEPPKMRRPVVEQNKPPKKSKAGKVILIIAIIIGVVLLCCCGGGVLAIIFSLGGAVNYEASEGISMEASRETVELVLPITEEDNSNTATTVYGGTTTPSGAFLDQVAIRFSDDSIMVCQDLNYAWYRSVEEAEDYHYRGMYTIYRGQEAFYHIVYEMSDYGITEAELNQYLKRNENSDLYNLDNLTVMILDDAETKIDGKFYECKERHYYGYINYENQIGTLVNMDSASEYTIKFDDYAAVCAAIENALEAETSEDEADETTAPETESVEGTEVENGSEEDTEIENGSEEDTEIESESEEDTEIESGSEENSEDENDEKESETADESEEVETQQGATADWTTLSFKLNGTKFTWPIDWKDIEEAGFTLPDVWESIELDEDEYSFLTLVEDLENQTSILLSLKNFGRGNEKKNSRDCEVYRIRIEETADETSKFELMTGIGLGSTREKVEAIYGECNKEEEDSEGAVSCRYDVTPDEHYSNKIEFTYEDDIVTAIEITNSDNNLN